MADDYNSPGAETSVLPDNASPELLKGLVTVSHYFTSLEQAWHEMYPEATKLPEIQKLLQEAAVIVAEHCIQSANPEVEVQIVELAAKQTLVALAREHLDNDVKLSAAGLSRNDMLIANFKPELLKRLDKHRKAYGQPAGVDALYAQRMEDYARKPDVWKGAGYATAEQYANFCLTGNMNTPPAGLTAK